MLDNEIRALQDNISKIISDKPTSITAVAKWFHSTPQLEEKWWKEQEQRQKWKALKKARKQVNAAKTTLNTHDSDGSDGNKLDLTGDPSDTDSDSSGQPMMKKARSLPEITAYINIKTPVQTAKTKPSVDACGPFFFMLDSLDSTHDEFLTTLAKTVLPAASIGSINQHKLFWKLNGPANDKQKPLSNTSGFCAMTTKLQELLMKNKDTMITLTLPPLL
ncbi:hypothetical protein L208DRAFT_1382525 [Tricholoma matsutake]|nr:hypothetical protein L208DRAFT_1382525 [Tricholoma matsutake 945]